MHPACDSPKQCLVFNVCLVWTTQKSQVFGIGKTEISSLFDVENLVILGCDNPYIIVKHFPQIYYLKCLMWLGLKFLGSLS